MSKKESRKQELKQRIEELEITLSSVLALLHLIYRESFDSEKGLIVEDSQALLRKAMERIKEIL